VHRFDRYDANGRLEQVTTPANDVVQTKVDEIARMSSVTPPGRAAHRFDFTPGDEIEAFEAESALADAWGASPAEKFRIRVAIGYQYDALWVLFGGQPGDWRWDGDD
jgi:hypothetical protein